MGYFDNTILDAQDANLVSVWKYEGNLIDDKGTQDLVLSGSAGSYTTGKHRAPFFDDLQQITSIPSNPN